MGYSKKKKKKKKNEIIFAMHASLHRTFNLSTYFSTPSIRIHGTSTSSAHHLSSSPHRSLFPPRNRNRRTLVLAHGIIVNFMVFLALIQLCHIRRSHPKPFHPRSWTCPL